MDYMNHEGVGMKRFATVATVLASMLVIAGCNQSGTEIDRVQTNLVEKSIFQGEWWYSQTIVGVDGDEAGIMGTFEGQMAWADLGVDSGQSGSLARIRWVIDENYLFAYRAYELIDGGNDDGREPQFRGQPLAVFAIQDHVDVQRDYNTVTGELTNVTVENTSDRRWYDRNFMRVDWSQNLVTSFFYLTGVDVFGNGQRESAPFFFQGGSHADFPDAYQPQFITVANDPDYRFADEWPTEAQRTVHYMSFVTQELLSPGVACLFYGIPCQTAAVTVRSSFLRVPPKHSYAVATQAHSEFDRFGTFRTYQRTYVRGGRPRDELREHCNVDADCGIGGLCDTEQQICTGGLTGDYGETDFLAFYRPRHNFWKQSLTDVDCRADWECDGRYGAGEDRVRGSVCDRAARRCTIPLASRETRRVTYRLNKGFPTHLVKRAFGVVGEWNESFMRGWRGVEGQSMPTGPNVDCQDTNPAAYCYCGSPDDIGDGTCRYRYDPFQSPEDATTAGVVDPYDCYIRNTAGWADPEHPTSYDEYTAPEVYNFEFVGNECLFTLKSNSCDATPGATCEELGDLRYEFFNYIQHGNLYFGGVSMPLVDPTTGELITANANMAGESMESIATSAINVFPVLRNEPGAVGEYFEGENVRDYMSRLGRTEHPVAAAASGTDGVPGGDRARPSGIPVGTHDRMSAMFEQKLPRIESLRGADGRARILSDRLRDLAGTPEERRLVGSMGPEGLDALYGTTDVRRLPAGASALDDAMLDQVSPFRANFISNIRKTNDVWQTLGRYNVDPPFAPALKDSQFQYWADAFAGRPAGEASIRMQQAFLSAVMLHELGHSVGLRHNFGGSFDRDNYNNGYFNRVLADDDGDGRFDMELPKLDEFDEDASGFVEGDEVNHYLARLRSVRDTRNAAGLGNVMGASIMDYDGDLSDLSGLGRYDTAAAVWNAFDVVEAFDGDPRVSSPGSLDGLTDSANTSRSWWHYYTGGESCVEDGHCPSSEASGLMDTQPVTQRCIQNPRSSRLPRPCGGNRDCICSNFDEDFLDYIHSTAYNNDVDGDGRLDHYPVEYLFCPDDRTSDISWCSRFDAGESFQESIDHFRRRWTEGYPFAYYRRFRNTALYGQASYTWILLAAKIYQHLFYRYFNEPGFRDDTGALGFDDQFQASIDAMNWLTEMVNLPDTGSYALNASDNVYERLGPDMDMPGSDFSLETGEGYPLYSKYQEGFYGFFRRERAGVLFDKLLALIALTRRDWKLNFVIDERFYINFFDLFPVEMTEFFGGLVLDDPHWFAPRVSLDGDGNPTIKNLSWFRGTCRDRATGEIMPCRGSQPDVYPGTPLSNTSTDLLRAQAATYALAEFPVYYDTSFEQRLLVFKRDSAEAFSIPDVQPDGATTCAYGSQLRPEHDLVPIDCDEADADYVVYESDRFHTEYIAVKVRPRLTYNLEEEQLGFELLRRLVDRQKRIHVLSALPSRTPAEDAELTTLSDRLTRDESFVEYLIDLQRVFGITSVYL